MRLWSPFAMKTIEEITGWFGSFEGACVRQLNGDLGLNPKIASSRGQSNGALALADELHGATTPTSASIYHWHCLDLAIREYWYL
jgi:hypothetical protein